MAGRVQRLWDVPPPVPPQYHQLPGARPAAGPGPSAPPRSPEKQHWYDEAGADPNFRPIDAMGAHRPVVSEPTWGQWLNPHNRAKRAERHEWANATYLKRVVQVVAPADLSATQWTTVDHPVLRKLSNPIERAAAAVDVALKLPVKRYGTEVTEANARKAMGGFVDNKRHTLAQVVEFLYHLSDDRNVSIGLYAPAAQGTSTYRRLSPAELLPANRKVPGATKTIPAIVPQTHAPGHVIRLVISAAGSVLPLVPKKR